MLQQRVSTRTSAMVLEPRGPPNLPAILQVIERWRLNLRGGTVRLGR